MNEEKIILTLSEDENGSSTVTDGSADGGVATEDSAIADDLVAAQEGIDIQDDTDPTGAVGGGETYDAKGEREEYERLIKTRFKELFAEDTQRLINKRFKKYKALEEKVGKLEEQARQYADIDSLLAAERERAVRETEDRLNLHFKTLRGRAVENALSPRSAHPSFDVSRLTKSERASLASRALKGEKIHL